MRFRTLLLVMLLARPASAQATDTARRMAGNTVTGVVRDSIGGLPLAGAVVQLIGANALPGSEQTAVANNLGEFTLTNVPDGHFTLGFIHPLLDSLGLEPPLRAVHVEGQRSVRVDLATPSSARLRSAICGAQSASVLIGFVRDASDHGPIPDATVTVEWLELSFGSAGIVRRIPRRVATTRTNGWFAMCDVPKGGMVRLAAARGADSTDLIELRIPTEGFLRHELYLGSAQTIGAVDRIQADGTPASSRRVRIGEGYLSGTVVVASTGKPLAGAIVSIIDGPQTLANERGEWTLAQAPPGTRVLEVRALGYYPERRPVNIVLQAGPVRVALSTLKAVLDTVRISASRNAYDRDAAGFQRRRRSGVGRYLTAGDIARRQPVVTSDLFRNLPGVRLEIGAAGVEKQLLVRGSLLEWCSPAIYLDGLNISGVTADDIDVWVHPREVAGIEVYAALGAPPEYQASGTGCGTILIWTK